LKNKKVNSLILVLLVFLITLAGSVVIIWLLNPKVDNQATADYSCISGKQLFSSEECKNVLLRSEKFLNGYFGEPSKVLKTVSNGKPGDKTDVYKTVSANYKKSKKGGWYCCWAQLWDDSVPAPRAIKIGMNYEEIMKKYPRDTELDNEFKAYNTDVDSLQYRMIYGEYEVSASYAISVWDVNNKASSAPVMLVYSDRDAEVTYHFYMGQLECVEYSLKK
jgi:preprotein translocase subunit SecG